MNPNTASTATAVEESPDVEVPDGYELIDGKLVEKSGGMEAGAVGANMLCLLGNYVKEQKNSATSQRATAAIRSLRRIRGKRVSRTALSWRKTVCRAASPAAATPASRRTSPLKSCLPTTWPRT